MSDLSLDIEELSRFPEPRIEQVAARFVALCQPFQAIRPEPLLDGGWGRYGLVRLAHQPRHPELMTFLHERFVRLAGIQELMYLDTSYPHLRKTGPIAGVAQEYTHPSHGPCVPYLTVTAEGDIFGRTLYPHHQWGQVWRFLVLL